MAEQENPNAPAAPNPHALPCIPFDGECLDRDDPSAVIDVSIEGATLLDTRACLADDGSVLDGCVDLEVILSDGEIATYTLSDGPCLGRALRGTGVPMDWYRDPSCFAGYVAIKRKLFLTTTSVEHDTVDVFGNPSDTHRVQTTVVEVQTPEHWASGDGHLGHFVYEGFESPGTDLPGPAGPIPGLIDPAWANRVGAGPHEGWHTIMTAQDTFVTDRKGAQVCNTSSSVMFDALGQPVGEASEAVSVCAIAASDDDDDSSGDGDARCDYVVSLLHPEWGAISVEHAERGNARCADESWTTEGSFLGRVTAMLGFVTAGMGGKAETTAESRITAGSTRSVDAQGCLGVIEEQKEVALRHVAAELANCHANPDRYFDPETGARVALEATYSNQAAEVADISGVPGGATSCSSLNGYSRPLVECQSFPEGDCCLTVWLEFSNCSYSSTARGCVCTETIGDSIVTDGAGCGDE